MKRCSAVAAISLVVLVLSVACTKNTTPPEYVADVVAYAEGYQAFVCYFVLADSSGRETASPGRASLKVFEEGWSWDEDETSELLFETSFLVSERDFQTATVGQGPFQRKRLLCPLGRIQYSRFRRLPAEMSGTVEIRFKVGGRELVGKTSIFFDVE